VVGCTSGSREEVPGEKKISIKMMIKNYISEE
jgi:hypothetical protein